MSWNPAGEDGCEIPGDAPGGSGGHWDGWPSAQTIRQTLSLQASDGSRRYELSYESRADGLGRVVVTGCDANGEVVADLRGDVLPAAIPLIAQLLMRMAGATPGDRRPPAPAGPATVVPGPRAPRTGELWGREETEQLVAAHREGADPAQIARRLERSEKSVRWKLYGLRLALYPEDLVSASRAAAPAGRPKPEKAYTVEEVQRQYPNAYKRWTSEEDDALKARCAEGASLAELAEEFGRNKGAIASRLLKLGAEGPAAEEAQEFGGDW
ncbi:hypothetical protein ACFVSN_30930 [Kitasatospora sp. NPDC057904]|uniref:hypothetical protein n=1 Tax=Kitasatospora sp. NPDC057904 TaxID=3346275 RepID=UPI0036DE94E7